MAFNLNYLTTIRGKVSLVMFLMNLMSCILIFATNAAMPDNDIEFFKAISTLGLAFTVTSIVIHLGQWFFTLLVKSPFITIFESKFTP